MKTVITYGTFDLFHIGHLNMLKRAKSLGDRLIVCVSTDEFNYKEKNKKCIIPYEDRAEIVRSIKGVDLVLPENSWDQKITDIQQHGVDVFVIGEDWKGKFDFLNQFCRVEYLERTAFVSTTDIKKTLARIDTEDLENVKKALDFIKSIISSIQ